MYKTATFTQLKMVFWALWIPLAFLYSYQFNVSGHIQALQARLDTITACDIARNANTQAEAVWQPCNDLEKQNHLQYTCGSNNCWVEVK